MGMLAGSSASSHFTSPHSEGLEALTLCNHYSMSPGRHLTTFLISGTTGFSFLQGLLSMGVSMPAFTERLPIAGVQVVASD